jgi:hypothetical protein
VCAKFGAVAVGRSDIDSGSLRMKMSSHMSRGYFFGRKGTMSAYGACVGFATRVCGAMTGERLICFHVATFLGASMPISQALHLALLQPTGSS